MAIESGSMERYASYSQFSSLTEFNHHIEMWMVDLKSFFTKGELIGLKRLIRFSAKIPGVCHAKIGTMLKAIQEDLGELGTISRATFKRMIQKAIRLGLLVVHETTRKNGSQSSNLYVFQRYPKKEAAPKATKTQTATTVPVKEDCKQETCSELHLDHTFTSDAVPTAFSKFVQYVLPDAATIEEFWRMTNIAAYRHCRENEPATVLQLAIMSMKQLIGKWKRSDTVKNPIAYYYGILNKKLEELYFEELYEMGFQTENKPEVDSSGLIYSISSFPWLNGI